MEDSFFLKRFKNAQDIGVYETALQEVKTGKKRTHWMWFIFPQVSGLGNSEKSDYYSIGSLREARAYLDDPVLGPRLREMCQALLSLSVSDPGVVFGYPDWMKLGSSMTLFDFISPEDVFDKVLRKFFAGSRDPRTKSIIRNKLLYWDTDTFQPVKAANTLMLRLSGFLQERGLIDSQNDALINEEYFENLYESGKIFRKDIPDDDYGNIDFEIKDGVLVIYVAYVSMIIDYEEMNSVEKNFTKVITSAVERYRGSVEIKFIRDNGLAIGIKSYVGISSERKQDAPVILFTSDQIQQL